MQNHEPKLLETAIERIAGEMGIEPAALMAVVKVESGGKLFALVDGRQEPLIRFEGHYFYRLLPTALRNRAVTGGLAHGVAGRVANPASQVARWKMLNHACSLDRQAALASVSWGVGQIMGSHWRWLGFGGIEALVGEVRSGLEGQLRLFARFIEKSGLAQKLAEHDWQGFARAYNGPDFQRHGYDKQMAKAYQRMTGASTVVRRNLMAQLALGARGLAVEELQRNLRMLGFALIADGDFGTATFAAMTAFQSKTGLKADGKFGHKTQEMMARYLPPAAQTR